MGALENQMYKLDCKVIKPETSAGAVNATTTLMYGTSGLDMKINEQSVKKLANSELAIGMNSMKQTKFCEGCIAGKMKKWPA